MTNCYMRRMVLDSIVTTLSDGCDSRLAIRENSNATHMVCSLFGEFFISNVI